MASLIDTMSEFSAAVAARAAAACPYVGAIGVSHGHIACTAWQSDLVVASEQSLPKREEFAVAGLASDPIPAKLVGRDPGTNIAVLKLGQPVAHSRPQTAPAQLGGLVLAFGADGTGSATVRLGVVNLAGAEWHSNAGGRIEQRIVLDLRLARREEGGPVFDAAGSLLGFSAFGPRRQVLVIPAATVDRIVPLLLKDGRVARGWLGAALQPVLIPDALRENSGQKSGLMVMSVADAGPAAGAGVLAGDILLSLDGVPMRWPRRVAALLGADSVGKQVPLRLIRGGVILTLALTIGARPET